LRKLAGNDDSEKTSFQSKKKGKTTSQPHPESQTTSAMMVTGSNRSSPSPAKKLQSCRHCGKFVIHTDGICDVYNVPSVNIASSGLTDTPNMSIVYQNIEFDTDKDNLEYLFVNDFGDLDDLTLSNFMKFVPAPIRTSPVYDDSEDDMAPVQALDHLAHPPDLPLITPDLLNVKHCTRPPELYNRTYIEVQNVDAQPLCYGRHQY
jgi:hypothetical protein